MRRIFDKWFDYLKSLQRLAYRAANGAKDAKKAQVQLMNRALLPAEVAFAVLSRVREVNREKKKRFFFLLRIFSPVALHAQLLRNGQEGDCFTVTNCSTPALAADRVVAHVKSLRRSTIVLLDVPLVTMLSSTDVSVWIRRIVPSQENGLKNTLQYTTRRLCNVYRTEQKGQTDSPNNNKSSNSEKKKLTSLVAQRSAAAVDARRCARTRRRQRQRRRHRDDRRA